MPFRMPELIIESIIRDGMENARRDLTIIDDVFSDLTTSYAQRKYGQKEIDKIKSLITNKEVSIVHAFNLVHANLPCISIQLADDREDEAKAYLGNYVGTQSTQFTDPEDLAALIVVDTFTPTSYNPKTGVLKVPDSVNLAQVHTNLLFTDASGNEFSIIGGIINSNGAKQIILEKNLDVSLSAGAVIKSSIDYVKYKIDGNNESVQLILGIHTKEPLLTKYLFTLVKYFTLSRRYDLIARGMNLNSYTSSDFSRDMQYGADSVFTRFFHLNGLVNHSWRHDKVELIDNVEVNVKIPKDKLGTEELNLEDQTITVKD